MLNSIKINSSGVKRDKLINIFRKIRDIIIPKRRTASGEKT